MRSFETFAKPGENKWKYNKSIREKKQRHNEAWKNHDKELMEEDNE